MPSQFTRTSVSTLNAPPPLPVYSQPSSATAWSTAPAQVAMHPDTKILVEGGISERTVSPKSLLSNFSLRMFVSWVLFEKLWRGCYFVLCHHLHVRLSILLVIQPRTSKPVSKKQMDCTQFRRPCHQSLSMEVVFVSTAMVSMIHADGNGC